MAVQSHHNTNLVKRLVYRLNEKGGKISYGGYCGFIVYVFQSKHGSDAHDLKIFYHHGSGKDAQVTEGMIEFKRFGAWVDGVDVYWLGHNHKRMGVPNARMTVKNNGMIDFYECRYVRSGSYMNYIEDSYPVGRGMQPGCHGGILLRAHFGYDGYGMRDGKITNHGARKGGKRKLYIRIDDL